MRIIDVNFILNEIVVNGYGFLPFIEYSVNKILNEYDEQNKMGDGFHIRGDFAYKLFYDIKDNVRNAFTRLFHFDIDTDYSGFPGIQRDLRCSIEAYLDLYNLVKDDNYKNVLMYCSNTLRKQGDKKKIELGNYSSELYKDEFTIQSKYNISSLEDESLLYFSRQTNSYTHPDIFIYSEANDKEDLLKKLLNKNLFLLVESYLLFIRHLKKSVIPPLVLEEKYNWRVWGFPDEIIDYWTFFDRKKIILENQLNNLPFITPVPNPVSYY